MKQTAHAHLNRSVGPYIEDMLQSFDRGIGFCASYNNRETEYHLCTIFKFHAHAQQLEKRRRLNYKQLTSVMSHFIILQPT